MKQRLNSLIPLLLLTCATVSSAQEKPAERINPYIALMESGKPAFGVFLSLIHI